MNTEIVLLDDVAVAGSLYYFENARADNTIADYTFVYTQVNNDTLQLSAQHSSLPYSYDVSFAKLVNYLRMYWSWPFRVPCLCEAFYMEV